MSVPFDDDPPEPPDDYDLSPADALLETIRDVIHTWTTQGSVSMAGARTIIEAADLLDDWITHGRDLPREWQRAGRPPVRRIDSLPPL
jgi:hypothetical protein